MNTGSWEKFGVGYQVLRSHSLGDDNLLNLAGGTVRGFLEALVGDPAQ